VVIAKTFDSAGGCLGEEGRPGHIVVALVAVMKP
jgi:hypothetical protein